MAPTRSVARLRLPLALSLLLLAVPLSGCAIGNTYNYRSPTLAQPWIEGKGTLAVATHDLRPDVVNGDETPDYVGLQRAGLGNPFDASTASSLPLSDDWTFIVTQGLTRGGFTATPISTSPKEQPDSVIHKLEATGAQASLLFVLNRWHSDTYNNVTLHHEVVLAVLDPAGKVLAEARLTGSSELGGSFFNPPAYAKRNVPLEFERKLAFLLRDPRIVQAIQTATRSTPPPAPPPAPPSAP